MPPLAASRAPTPDRLLEDRDYERLHRAAVPTGPLAEPLVQPRRGPYLEALDVRRPVFPVGDYPAGGGLTSLIGQTRIVTSYKLIATGTVEEKVLALQAEKRALLANVFEASDAVSAKLTLGDLRELLR